MRRVRSRALAACAAVACIAGCEEGWNTAERARAAETMTPAEARQHALAEQADVLRERAKRADDIAGKRGEVLEAQAKLLDMQAQLDAKRQELARLEAEHAAALRQHPTPPAAPPAAEPAPQVEQNPPPVPPVTR